MPFTGGVKGQDSGQMVWNLWQTLEALTHGRNPYFNPAIFSPAGAPLAQHTLAAGFVPVTAIVKILSGNAPLAPLYAYHIVVWLCFTLLLFFSYQFLRELQISHSAAALAAWGYAFADFYNWHTVHLNHLAGWFIPLTAWGLARCWRQPSGRRALWPAVTAGCAVYFTEFAAYIGLGAALCGVGLCAQRETRAQLRGKLQTVGYGRLALAGLLTLLLALPFLWQLQGLAVRKPMPQESALFSANLAGFFVPEVEQSPVYAPLFGGLARRVTAGMNEPGAFLGFPVILLAVLGLWRKSLASAYKLWLTMGLAVIFAVLSLGPRLQVFGTDTGWPLPYAVLGRVPPFDLSRTPVRFVVLASFFLMIVAAHGAQRLLAWACRRWGWRGAWAVGAVLAVWLLADSYAPAPPSQKFTPPDLSRLVAGPVLNLPLYRTDGYAALLQTQHRQPIATGYLARNTETTWAHYIALERLVGRGGTAF